MDARFGLNKIGGGRRGGGVGVTWILENGENHNLKKLGIFLKQRVGKRRNKSNNFFKQCSWVNDRISLKETVINIKQIFLTFLRFHPLFDDLSSI